MESGRSETEKERHPAGDGPIRADPLRTGLLLSLLANPSDDIWDRAVAAMHTCDARLCLSVEAIWELAQTQNQRRRLAVLLCPGIHSGKHFEYRLERHRDARQDYVGITYWVRKDLPVEDVPAAFQNQGGSSWGSSVCETFPDISREKWRREEAAIWVLEAISTDDALALVKRMATGHPDARPTIAAKEVLARRYPK